MKERAGRFTAPHGRKDPGFPPSLGALRRLQTAEPMRGLEGAGWRHCSSEDETPILGS